MRVARVSLAILLTVSSVWSTACQTGTPTMSLEEAKAITASFAAQDFAPPPRTIKDVRSLLRLALDPYRVEGDLSPPSGQTDSATLARFHLARGRAARRMGRIRQAIDDLTRAAEYGKPGQATLPAAFTRPESGNFVRAIEPDLGRVILQDLADTYAAAGNYWQAIATYE